MRDGLGWRVGNPVILSIDPGSASVCSITGSSVTFNNPGSCVIDANQAGTAKYQAAPPAQQTITVSGTKIAPVDHLHLRTAQRVANIT